RSPCPREPPRHDLRQVPRKAWVVTCAHLCPGTKQRAAPGLRRAPAYRSRGSEVGSASTPVGPLTSPVRPDWRQAPSETLDGPRAATCPVLVQVLAEVGDLAPQLGALALDQRQVVGERGRLPGLTRLRTLQHLRRRVHCPPAHQ